MQSFTNKRTKIILPLIAKAFLFSFLLMVAFTLMIWVSRDSDTMQFPMLTVIANTQK